MNIALSTYDDLVHGIYDAGLQPTHWPNVMSQLAGVFDVPQALMFTFAHSPAQGGFTFSHNITQASLEVWGAKGINEDPWVQSSARQGFLVEGTVAIDSQLLPEEELLRTDFYREILEPLGISKVCSGVVFDGTDAHKIPTALSVFRGLKDPAFNSGDAELTRRLILHFSRSLGVMFHLRDSQLQVASTLAALDSLACGVALLSPTGQVQFANQAAQEHLRKAEGLRIRPAQGANAGTLALHPRLLSFEGRFQQSLHLALTGLTDDAQEGFSEAILLPAVQGPPSCVVHVAPLGDARSFSGAGAAPSQAIVFIYDLHQASSVPIEQMMTLFGMTRAEALVARQITQGGTVEQMAERLGITGNTFKTQLQAVYAKSGTRRQTDLLKLMLALSSR